ncbi:MAG: hypothetical protein EBW11_06860, partial [Betaproteobacteria bacterium]|nr:hypothetical protein [Betaproteobacteria bacterium]
MDALARCQLKSGGFAAPASIKIPGTLQRKPVIAAVRRNLWPWAIENVMQGWIHEQQAISRSEGSSCQL